VLKCLVARAAELLVIVALVVNACVVLELHAAAVARRPTGYDGRLAMAAG